jgi:hypothetical protein
MITAKTPPAHHNQTRWVQTGKSCKDDELV